MTPETEAELLRTLGRIEGSTESFVREMKEHKEADTARFVKIEDSLEAHKTNTMKWLLGVVIGSHGLVKGGGALWSKLFGGE